MENDRHNWLIGCLALLVVSVLCGTLGVLATLVLTHVQ